MNRMKTNNPHFPALQSRPPALTTAFIPKQIPSSIRWAGCMIAALAVMAESSGAALIYSENFSGLSSTLLNGQAPQTRPGTETWTASASIKADGTAVFQAFDEASSFLPFAPIGGQVYTLTATLAQPGPRNADGQWGGIGFTAGNTVSTAIWRDPNLASPWMLYRNNDPVVTFTGTGTTGSESEGNFTGTQTLTIVLDTTADLWTAAWKVGGTSVRTHTFATNPTINYVAFGRASAGVDFDSFTLDVIPEPGSVAMLGIGGLAMLMRRRLRRAKG
jgi:hypothetical protein